MGSTVLLGMAGPSFVELLDAFTPQECKLLQECRMSILRSQPAISWAAFGFPDGRFFGAQKRPDGEIHMVELYMDPPM